MTQQTLYLIHHSHTDIGYTDRQEKISRYHVQFIKQAITILDNISLGVAPEWEGYKYVCENYWQVEQFLKKANQSEVEKFEYYVNQGLIDISLSYLNFTELVDADILNKKFAEAKNYTNQFEQTFDSAMTADINGFSWGYVDLMQQNGINNFFSCLHTHHGMFPLFKKQTPFYWEGESGEKVLVWNGDHYQIGNDFLFSPNTDQSCQYGVDGFTAEDWKKQFEITKEKVFGFFDVLKEENYEFDFCPVMISGIVTDNSPTSARMMEGIHRWNQHYGDEIKVELVTLNEFFRILRGKNLSIPTFKGDWADWWADGVSSTPAGVKLYRDAQRKYRLVNKLDKEGTIGNSEQLKKAETQLAMYAEHTWGFHSSVSEPWDSFVNLLDSRKFAYAVNGNQLISEQLDDILEVYGEEANQLDKESYFKVINPHTESVEMNTSVYIQHWQTVDDSYFYTSLNDFVEVVDCLTGEVLDSQVSNSSRGKEISFYIALSPKEERIIKLRRQKPVFKMDTKYYNHAHIGTERVADIAPYKNFLHDISIYGLETDYLKIVIDPSKGIESIIDKKTCAELIHKDSTRAAFSGVYEVTSSSKSNPYSVRSLMGRNRKSPATKRYESRLVDLKIVEDGLLYAVLEMNYELEGTKMYDIRLKVYKKTSQIDVSIRLQKNGTWDPENLYITLPFTYGDVNETTTYFEKSGSIFRPGIDQLPGTNTNFYLLDNGALFTNQNNSLFIAMKDTPLVTLGALESQLIELCNEESEKKNKEVLYSWAMNNFWETNFKVDLSGFYELDYSLYVTNQENNVKGLVNEARNKIEGLIAIPYNPTQEEQLTFKEDD